MYDKIYCISAKNTVWAPEEVRQRNGVDEILCFNLHKSVYYCPDLHVLFYRYNNPEGCACYGWDYAVMKALDNIWGKIKTEPLWRTHICRIDAPKPEPMTEEEVLANL